MKFKSHLQTLMDTLEEMDTLALIEVGLFSFLGVGYLVSDGVRRAERLPNPWSVGLPWAVSH